MENESTLYPADILMSKYVPLVNAVAATGVDIRTLYKLVESQEIPYALFRDLSTSKKRIIHVNPEDIEAWKEKTNYEHRTRKA